MNAGVSSGVSFGTVLLGAVVVVGVAYILYKYSENQPSNDEKVEKLLADDDRYNAYKEIIEDAIKEKDWQTLEEFSESKAKKYPKLIKMIQEALNKRK